MKYILTQEGLNYFPSINWSAVARASGKAISYSTLYKMIKLNAPFSPKTLKIFLNLQEVQLAGKFEENIHYKIYE